MGEHRYEIEREREREREKRDGGRGRGEIQFLVYHSQPRSSGKSKHLFTNPAISIPYVLLFDMQHHETEGKNRSKCKPNKCDTLRHLREREREGQTDRQKQTDTETDR